MATTPFLLMIARRFEFASPSGPLPEGPENAGAAEAIVVGFGRFGQTVAQMLYADNLAVTLIDIKPRQIEVSAEFGGKVYFGDGRRLDLLRIAGADRARIIAFCIDDADFGAKELAPILHAFPDAAIMVRAFDRRQMMAFEGAKTCFAVREVYESAVLMGRHALAAAGVAEDRIIGIERDYRTRDADRLAAQSATGDLHAMDDTLFRSSPDAPVREA